MKRFQFILNTSLQTRGKHPAKPKPTAEDQSQAVTNLSQLLFGYEQEDVE